MVAAAASTSAQANAPPLGKHLASTDKKTRDKAVKDLSVFLSDPARAAMPPAEMAKLWKGIFYCFWMSDKPLVQQALASSLAELLLSIPTPTTALEFLRGFWESTVREWAGIDRYRIDKFYMLIRRFTNAAFRLLMRESWPAPLCAQYTDILTARGGPLCPDDIKVPPSLAYHLADIYLEELDKAFASSEQPSPAPLSLVMDPFFSLAARTGTKTVVQRVQSAVLDPLFSALDEHNNGSDEEEDEEDDEEDADAARHRKRPRLSAPEYSHVLSSSCLVNSEEEGALSAGALKKGLLKRLFEVASDERTRDANRRKMYAFWKSHADDAEESD
ncbi:Nop52-domain-containing protein [Trametopsis cervina]|nr:Nop52-domain-containing protein [Trametopsis cervina]